MIFRSGSFFFLVTKLSFIPLRYLLYLKIEAIRYELSRVDSRNECSSKQFMYLDLHVGDSEPIFFSAVSHFEEKSTNLFHPSLLLLLFVPPFPVVLLLHLARIPRLWPVQLAFLKSSPQTL